MNLCLVGCGFRDQCRVQHGFFLAVFAIGFL